MDVSDRPAVSFWCESWLTFSPEGAAGGESHDRKHSSCPDQDISERNAQCGCLKKKWCIDIESGEK